MTIKAAKRPVFCLRLLVDNLLAIAESNSVRRYDAH